MCLACPSRGCEAAPFAVPWLLVYAPLHAVLQHRARPKARRLTTKLTEEAIMSHLHPRIRSVARRDRAEERWLSEAG